MGVSVECTTNMVHGNIQDFLPTQISEHQSIEDFFINFLHCSYTVKLQVSIHIIYKLKCIQDIYVKLITIQMQRSIFSTKF